MKDGRSVASVLPHLRLLCFVGLLCSCGASGKAGESTRTTAPPTATSAVAAPTTSVGTTALSPSSAPTAAVITAPPGGYLSVIGDKVVNNPALNRFEADTIRRMKQAGLPGASLLVVQRGQLVQQEAWLDYTLDTVVPIASGSKWLSATMIMTLVEEGRIGLDSPISTYLPYTEGRDAGRITMRQLLSFTSGIIDDDLAPCARDAASSLQACARELLARPLVHPPGAVFRYGGQHLLVAGAIAETVTGQSFVELFNTRIAGPLKMTSTYFFNIGDARKENVTNPMPAGSAASTLGDYARFLEMIYHEGLAPSGKRILSPASISEMQKNQISAARYGQAASFRVAAKAPYGFGEWLDWTDAAGNALVLSSDGAFGFRPWIDKKNDLFGVYLVNDRGQGFVEGNPNAASGDEKRVHTSGNWVFADVAEALGGSLPADKYPGR